MKILYISICIIILTIIVLLIIQNKNKNLSTASTSAPSTSPIKISSSTQVTINNILTNLKKNSVNNPLTLDLLKSVALSNGITVIGDTEAHTMEYNPTRVIVDKDFNIVSIG